jgi:hypothetical protein
MRRFSEFRGSKAQGLKGSGAQGLKGSKAKVLREELEEDYGLRSAIERNFQIASNRY